MMQQSDAEHWQQLRRQMLLSEDQAIVAFNKPPGVTVVGEHAKDDIVEIALRAGEQLLPVHRIDKVTSGLVVCAKSPDYHGDLTRQFNKRTVDKAYLVIVRTASLPATGTIELPLSQGRKGRVRVAAPRQSIMVDAQKHRWYVRSADVLDGRTYPSLTQFATVWSNEQYSLLVVRPVTGRRHQIRVHLAWIGHPILGDPLFPQADALAARTFLHSWRLGFDAAWQDNARRQLEAPPGQDFWQPITDAYPDIDPAALLQRAEEAIGALE